MNPVVIPTRKRKVECIEIGNQRCLRTEDGAEFHIDQDAMRSSSKYFNSLFLYDSRSDILVSGISGKIMRFIVDFLQKRTVMLKSDNLISLLEAADYFVLEELTRKIISAIPDLICEDNVIDLYHAALNLKHLSLCEVIHAYVLAHFYSVAVKSDIGELCYDHFDKLLSDCTLNVRDEDTVWTAIVKWVEAEEESRRESVPLLLRHIRAEFCSRSFFENLFQHPLIQESEFFASITACNRLRPREYKFLRRRFITCIGNQSRNQLNHDPRVPRMEFRVYCNPIDQGNEMEIAIGPVNDKTKETIIAKKIRSVPKFVLLFGRKICLFEEFGCQIDFSLTRGTWSKHPLLNGNLQSFEYFEFSTLGETIFAVSVEYNPAAHAVVSIYNSNFARWERLSSCCLMPGSQTRVRWLQTCELKGIMCIAVTCDTKGYLTTLAKIFYPPWMMWASVTLPGELTLSQKKYFSMAVVQGEIGGIYFIGSDSISMKMLDLDSETWVEFERLPFTFNKPRICVVEGNIVLYETDGGRHPIIWVEEEQQWMPFTYSMVLELDIPDDDVNWWCYCEYRRREWKRERLPFKFKKPLINVVDGYIILYEIEGGRRPIIWFEDEHEWEPFTNSIMLDIDIPDDEVNWWCYCEYRRREWKRADPVLSSLRQVIVISLISSSSGSSISVSTPISFLPPIQTLSSAPAPMETRNNSTRVTLPTVNFPLE